MRCAHFAGADAPSNPLLKQVVLRAGRAAGELRGVSVDAGWHRCSGSPACWARSLLLRTRHPGLTFVASGLGVAGIIATAGVSLFPFLLPSSLDPNVRPDGVGRVVQRGDAGDHGGA